MSLTTKLLETIVQVLPDRQPDKLIQRQTSYIGQPVSRVDGPLKVTGEATFSAEYQLAGMCFAAVAYSTIAKGKITRLHTASAQAAAGVLAVITHENSPKLALPPLFHADGKGRGSAASPVPVLQEPDIHWNGQPIALVVADTQEAAEHAAALVTAEYEPGEAYTAFEAGKQHAKTPDALITEDPEITIGAAEKQLAQAAHRVDNVYHTPYYNHNALEPHSSIATFEEDGKLVVFDSTQHLRGVRDTLAIVFGLKSDRVQVCGPFVGGGFGGKGSVWLNTLLCTLAARQVGRPVKLALSREGVFRLVGGRAATEQRVALGADTDGKFQAIIHEGISPTTEQSEFAEPFTLPVRAMYAADSFAIRQKIFNLDTVTNTFMRAPGESVGTFALESAVDELAQLLHLDPLELRLRNEPTEDPVKHTKFSLRTLPEAYRRGAAKFGWQPRPPRTQREGEWLIGQGVAAATYPVQRMPASAKIVLYADGTVVVKAAAHEMGMGTATVQLQHAADRLGLPIEKLSFQYGDSELPNAGFAGGSMQTITVAAGIAAAADKLQTSLLDLAQQQGASPLRHFGSSEVELKNEGLYARKDAARGQTYAAILKATGLGFLEAEAAAPAPLELLKYSMHSYGAQFAEVRVNAITGEVRVARWVGSFDVGRVLNPKTAASQLRGGIIMGIGMALTEETFLDERTGRIVNASLAEYHVPVHADVPYIEVLCNDIPDEHTPLGAHGIGEIGITGCAAAIANAIFNATGTRIRSLPITLDKVLAG